MRLLGLPMAVDSPAPVGLISNTIDVRVYNPRLAIPLPCPSASGKRVSLLSPQDWLRRLDWCIVLAAAVLVSAGCVAIQRYESVAALDGPFFERQIIWAMIGVVVMFATTLVSYRRLMRFAYALFAVALALLIGVYFTEPINGAHRWIRVGGIGGQPSELAKIACVVALARYLMYRENYRRFRGLLVPIGVSMIPVFLILREPDLGTALVFFPVLFSMLYAAGARSEDLVKIGFVGVALLPVLWLGMSAEQRSRVTAVAQQPAADEAPTGDEYHLRQAKQMLSLGGVFGSWASGREWSDAAAYHLPEGHCDFIFCVIGERFGWFGTGGLLLLYLVLIRRGAQIASATREPFGRLIASGLTALIGIQVVINTAMTVGLTPITGLSLPLVSYGGSGLLVHAAAIGLLLNIGMRPGYEVTKEPFRYVKELRGAARRSRWTTPTDRLPVR